MKRDKLQATVLTIWVLGFLATETIIVIAHVNRIDAYTITLDDIQGFQNRFQADYELSAVTASAEKLEVLIGDREVGDCRTRNAFEELLAREWPQGGGSPEEREKMIKWSGVNFAEDKLMPFYSNLFEIYLPWISIMTIGLLYENRMRRKVHLVKARVCIGVSVTLQLIFILGLVGLLFFGDLGSSRNLQSPAAAIASFVGILVHFVFPQADQGRGSVRTNG